jgi:hypothetical protein
VQIYILFKEKVNRRKGSRKEKVGIFGVWNKVSFEEELTSKIYSCVVKRMLKGRSGYGF